MVIDLFDERDMILESKNLTKVFTSYKGEALISCNQVSLKVYKGKTLGIVGESGSGKTTYIRMLMNLEKPTSGEILYHHKNIHEFSQKEIWESHQNIQMIFQDSWAAFSPKMKVIDILTEPLMNYGRLRNSEKKKKLWNF